MTVFHAKIYLTAALVAVLVSPAVAQTSDMTPSSMTPSSVTPSSVTMSGRDASFLPPVTPTPLPQTTQQPTASPALPETTAPLIITAPVSAPAPSAPTAAPALTLSQPPLMIAPPAVTEAAPAGALVPGAAASAHSGALALPPAIAKPVESASIGAVDPESIGLMANAEGGLGADMWKGTTRAFVVKLFQALNLPTASKVLNNLAQRFLLTTALVPEGTTESNQSLTSMRVEKLLALGDTQDAWKLAMLASPDQIDEITLRLLAEAALLSPQRDDVCAKLPDIVKTHNGVEWQKLMLVCQLRANDTKAAQVTLDLLHAQNVKDDIFFFVAEKSILGNLKQLPRQLTPLKPLTLALLRLTDLPLPGEIYVHPEADLIPELLAGKAREDVARIGLAERAAERGLIRSSDLTAVYQSTTFSPDVIANASNGPETGPRLHAALYQAARQEKSPVNRIADAMKYMQTISPALVNGAGAGAMVDMIGDVTPTANFNATSSFVAHIYILAGKNDAALEWLKLAKHVAIETPSVADDLVSFWPLTVFSGMESSTDYASDLNKWLDSFLKNVDLKTAPGIDSRARYDQAASLLLLLEADGFTVPMEAWTKVMDGPTSDRRIAPSPVFLERLRSASTSPRRGEIVLLVLALAGNSNDVPLLSTIESVRALRLVGLSADAAMLARATANSLLTPTKP